MVFIQCLLVPRYLRLTRSMATTVILGGVAYTVLHCFDAWLAYTTPAAAALSVIFLLFQYLGPSMIKTVLTLRTGNAWVHVWAYHAISPHTIVDAPLIAKISRIGAGHQAAPGTGDSRGGLSARVRAVRRRELVAYPARREVTVLQAGRGSRPGPNRPPAQISSSGHALSPPVASAQPGLGTRYRLIEIEAEVAGLP
jgi:hypothetical protein